ncbi:kinase-like domain-containing protein [Amanita rubescens]|nr:kinase-like domain-containing protein [Amanita rubescens]
MGSTQSPVFVAPPVLEPLDVVKDLAVIPHTPLPSTPVFEDSLSISASPCTPSLICSTPALSSPTSDVSRVSFSEPRVVNIRDFELLEFLSKGSSGQVYLARDHISSKKVALKVIRKVAGEWDHPLMAQILIEEKKIMASLQGSDWFVQLEASWHDTNNIYLAMMYYPTDIESEIIRCDKFPADRARFYMAEIIIAMEELHKRGIVHRDIKAANILIRSDGHIVLADFGLAKDFGSKPTIAERSYQPYWPFKTDDNVFEGPRRLPTELTFVSKEWCGSEMEMAPEIVRRDYYSFGVDYWSAGVTLYAMVTGSHPWDDEEEVGIQILEDDIQFAPEDDISDECKDFLHQMLKKNPAERLRIGLDMTSHPYFAGVDWEAMRNRTVLPPWVPDFVKGHHFFEDWGTIERFIPGSAPSEEEEAILPNLAFTSPNLQCNGIKDILDCGSPNPERDINEEFLNSIPSNPQQSFPEDAFGHLFASELEDDMDEEEELWTLEIDDNDDALPVNVVKAHFPTISTPEPHIPMLPSVHSGSSLLAFVESEYPSEPELHAAVQPSQPVICHVPEPISVQVEYCIPESTLVMPELAESSSLSANPLATSSSECIVEPLVPFCPTAPKSEATEPVVGVDYTTVGKSAVETNWESTIPVGSPVPRLLRFATPPSGELTVNFTRPAPFQAVLEPLAECAEPASELTSEPTFEPSMNTDYVPEEQLQRESRAIVLYNKVMTWLRKLLPWSRKREDTSRLTLPTCDDSDSTSLWESIKWKFQKIWMPKVKRTQCLQRKRTILY